MGADDSAQAATYAKSPLRALALMMFVMAIVVAALGAWALSRAAGGGGAPGAPAGPLEPDPNVAGLTIPDFTLTNQAGETVSRASLLKGHVTIVDFIFTNCPFICPPMTNNMRALQEKLAGSGVRFASFSVDPKHDTPEALRNFANAHGADFANWSFLTGDIEQVQRILTQGLHLDALAPIPSVPIKLKDGATMANIRHPSHFVLVGPDARVLTLTLGTQPALHDAFAQRARSAVEAAQTQGRAAQAAPGGAGL